MRICYSKLELAYAIGTWEVRMHEGMPRRNIRPIRGIQQLAYSMALPEPQEYAESKYLGHRMLFILENQRSYKYKKITKNI